MHSENTLAVVLKVMDHGESDKIVTLYCPKLGKQTGIAKGAKYSKKRFMNKLEIFTLLNVLLTRKEYVSMARIDKAELIASFPSLRADYKRYWAASLICEQIIHWTRENDENNELFNLLTWGLERLEKGPVLVGTVILFHVKMFAILGYKPRISGCVLCGNEGVKEAPYSYNLGRNGLICKTCSKNVNDPVHQESLLSLNTVRLLQKAQELPVCKLGRLRFSAAPAREAAAFLKGYGRHLLQREVHSWKSFECLLEK